MKRLLFFMFLLGITNLQPLFAKDLTPNYTSIIVDKDKNELFVYSHQKQKKKPKLIKKYHATLGIVSGDKNLEGDRKTPEGIYFVKSKLSDRQLDERFGKLGLHMNYPNPMDLRHGKTGSDIMIHGTNKPRRLSKNYDSLGCIVVNNKQVDEISKKVQLDLTPVIVYEDFKKSYFKHQAHKKVKETFQKWLKAWDKKNLNQYVSQYVEDFKSANGKGLKAYKRYKGQLNRLYDEINVTAKNVRTYYHPKYPVLIFRQNYQSTLENGKVAHKSLGTKMLYFNKVAGKYKIAAERFTPQTVQPTSEYLQGKAE